MRGDIKRKRHEMQTHNSDTTLEDYFSLWCCNHLIPLTTKTLLTNSCTSQPVGVTLSLLRIINQLKMNTKVSHNNPIIEFKRD